MTLRASGSATQAGFGPHVPETFSSLEEARNSLEYHSNRYIGFLRSTENGVLNSEAEAEDGRIFWRSLLQQWDEAFEKFLQHTGSNLDIRSQQAALVLKMDQRISAAVFTYPMSILLATESKWDDFVPLAEEIVDLAEQVLALEKTTETRRRPMFSFDVNIVSQLYSVCQKCRDPTLRRRCIALLRAVPRQEGVWNSTMAAHVAERIMHIEESGLGEVKSCRDIPDWARISHVVASFDPVERKASFSYSRQRCRSYNYYCIGRNEDGLTFARKTVSETLTW